MLWRCCLLTVMLCSFSILPQDDDEEYAIKAAFIYKFTNYIDWDALVSGNSFTIGIMGSSPIKEELEKIASSKNINNKRVVIRQIYNADDIGVCHILFISQRCKVPLDEILGKASAKGTLTISEKPGYGARGVQINFTVVDDKLKFEANTKAINAAGLKASSQLLKLAIIVG